MKAAVVERFGDPAEVLQVKEVSSPEPASGEVRVRMIASPINPSDLLSVRGTYGRRPKLPYTPGFEGVGVVEKNGGGWLGKRVMGKRVAVLNGYTGNWQEQVVIPSRQAVPVPDDIPDEQVASFFVNPATVVVMVERVLRVRAGEWLAQTAAASALGKMVVRLGKHASFRTINIVRRRESADELMKLGADAVINTAEESVESRVKEITGGKGAKYAIDAVGGDPGAEVVKSLGAGGKMLVYGTLSEEPLKLHPRTLIVGEKSVSGFWLAEWSRAQGPLGMLMLFRRIKQLMRAGILISEIGESFSLDDVAKAAAHAAQPGRTGKVLLWMNDKRPQGTT